MKFMKVLLAIIVVGTVFSGCVNLDDSAPESITPVLFEASYETPEMGHLDLVLSGPESIHGRDGNSTEAYTLSVDGTSLPTPFQFHLGGDFRLLRYDLVCAGVVEGECAHAEAIWAYDGSPSPFGLSFRADPGSDWSINGIHQDFTLETIYGNNHDTIAVSDYPPSEIVLFGDWINGEYHYSPGEFLPTKMIFEDEGGTLEWNRTSYEPLSPIHDLLPQTAGAAVPDSRTKSGMMFPGENEDDMGNGIPHIRAVEELTDRSTSADSSLADGGCITAFTNRPSGEDESPVESVQNSVYGDSPDWFDVRIQDAPPPGSAREWPVAYQESLVDDDWSVGEAETVAPLPQNCAAIEQSPWPKMSSTEFIDLTTRLPISHIGTTAFAMTIASEDKPGVSAETGFYRYMTAYRPEYTQGEEGSVSFVNYRVGFDPHRGVLDYIRAHPDDIEELDR